MRSILLFLIFFISAPAVGQQIKTGNSGFQVSEIMFDEAFIKLYKIKNISTQNSIKRDGQPLRVGKNYYQWEFDRNGRVVEEIKTIPNLYRNTYDTVVVKMEYDEKGQLFSKREYVGQKVKVFTYLYNENGDPVRTDMAEQLLSNSAKKLNNRVDSFAYQFASDSIKVKNTINEEGTTYREEKITYDDQHRITESSGRYLRGYLRTKEQVSYNDEGLVDERTLYTDVDKNLFERYEFQYDNLGNINRIIGFKEDVKRRQLDFVYFENSITVQAIIDQEIATHDLNILEFVYDFYDGYSHSGE